MHCMDQKGLGLIHNQALSAPSTQARQALCQVSVDNWLVSWPEFGVGCCEFPNMVRLSKARNLTPRIRDLRHLSNHHCPPTMFLHLPDNMWIESG